MMGTAMLIALVTAVVVALTMPSLIRWLRRRAVLDIPNERSSHSEVTPRGGGIAVVAGIFVGLAAAWAWSGPAAIGPVPVLPAAMLALVSWFDDRRGGLPVVLRLGIQALAVGIVLALLPAEAAVAHGLIPVWLERIVLFLAWVWFTNLFNFMDGINGITGVEMIGIGVGAALVAAMNSQIAMPGMILAGAALGFLPWNWGARARVFLGDVGSVPAGYLLGAVLLALALDGKWAAALILPMYYWMDATVTLLRRLARGEKVWQAHRSHFYQQGVRKLGSHAAVAGHIAVLNLMLIALALISTLSAWHALGAVAAALLLTGLLCRHFAAPTNPVV